MNVNPKHDRQGVRTPTDVERKYNLGDIATVADAAANAQRSATNAQSVASEANATAPKANATATQAKSVASEAVESAAAANDAIKNVYSKDETLSDSVRTQLGLAEGATPNDAFAALGMNAGGETASYVAGDNVKIEGNVISVITTDEAELDNTRPITSAGVYTQIGNINVLLSTI